MNGNVMNKCYLIKRVLPVLFALFLVFAVSCSNEAGDRLVSVNFDVEPNDGSRALAPYYERIVAPEDCFWTYTAVKTAGNAYATGASMKNNDGKLIERPVNTVKGLKGVTCQFSLGTWTFNVFGYADNEHTKLIYTAEKTGVSFTSSSAQTVGFTLNNVGATSGLTFTTTDLASSADKAFTEKGVLAMGDVTLTVPYGYTFRVDSGILVEILEGSAKVASSYTTVVGSDVSTGAKVHLNPFTVVSGKELFSEGLHTLTVKVTYSRTPYPTETSVSSVQIGTGTIYVPFTAGTRTTLSGNVSDLTWDLPSLTRHPVGGTIFYVDADNGGVYRFYDYLGAELTTHTVDGLKTAAYYTVESLDSSAKDKFYVFNKDAIIGRINLSAKIGSTYDAVPEKGLGLGDTTLVGLTASEFGSGRANTARIRSSSSYATVCNVAQWTTTAGGNKCTFFYILEKWNAGTGVIIGGSLKNTTGVYDWYIPSLDEIEKLAITYFGGAAGWNAITYGGSTFYCYSSTVGMTTGTIVVPDCEYVSFNGAGVQCVTSDTSASTFGDAWKERGTVFIRSF